MIFDTHAHYDDESFEPDRDELLSGMREKNVGWIVNVGNTADSNRVSVALAERYDFIYAAVGLHPDEAGGLTDEFFSWMREEARTNPKVVAIGEIGLDYHWNVEPHEVQREAFLKQIDLARELSLPIEVHSRDAAQDTMEIMREYGKGLSGIIHCYSYSAQMARDYVRLGFHIGIGGGVTRDNARKLKETAAEIPLTHIVLETDCPYQTPAAYRGERNSSEKIACVAEEIARLRGISADEVIEQTTANAKKLFGIG